MPFFKKPVTEYSDPVNGERWYQEDLAHVTEAADKANAKNIEAIKDSAARGVNPGISLESGRMVPAPPGYDVFSGKLCSGPGLKRNGFGNAKACGRPATVALQTLDRENFTLDAPGSPSAELTNDVLAYMAYGSTAAYGSAAAANPVPAATGRQKGHMVTDPNKVNPKSKFVCHFHAQALYRDSLHPEDGGTLPEVPRVTGDLVFGLDKLTPGRHFRCVGSDASFAWVTDGKVTVMCHKRDYVALLAEYGLLPDDPMVPLPLCVLGYLVLQLGRLVKPNMRGFGGLLIGIRGH